MQLITMNDQPAVVELKLAGCQDVRAAGDLQQKLIELLSQDRTSVIHCEDIQSMDASTIQLLLAAKRESGNDLTLIASTASECARWIQLSGVAGKLLNTKE